MSRLKLDLNLLSVLDILLQEKHVGRAARRLNLSQPAVSGALGRLRKHFNDDLFVRRGARMDPTPFALELGPLVQELILQARAVANAKPAFDAGSVARTFVIFASDYMTITYLNGVLKSLPDTTNGVAVVIEPLSVESETRFASGQADFLISPKAYKHPHVNFTQDQLVALVCARNSQSRKRLSASAYRNAGHIAPLLGRDIARRLDPLGERRRIVAQAPFAIIPEMLLGTPYIAVVPERFARMQAERLPLKVLPLPSKIPALVEQLYWRKEDDMDPASKWMRSHLLGLRDAIIAGQQTGG